MCVYVHVYMLYLLMYLSNACSILKLKVRKFGLFHKSNKAPFCFFTLYGSELERNITKG